MFGKKEKPAAPRTGATRKGASPKHEAHSNKPSSERTGPQTKSNVTTNASKRGSQAKGAVKAAVSSDTASTSSRKTSLSSTALQQHGRYHQACARNSWARLKTSRLATVMTSALMAVSLTLPMLLLLLVSNLQQLSSGWQDQLSVSVYLQTNLSEKRMNALHSELASLTGVASSRLITPEQGLSDFKSLTGSELLSVFDRNPLPAVVELVPVITPQEGGAASYISALVSEIETLAGVDEVIYDQQWIERLLNYVGLAERFALLIGLLLALAAVLAISNTIRLEIENRRQEIIVIKLVGGTDRFIRLPFLYSGFWYGVLGATLATLSLWVIGLWLSPFLTTLLSLYSSDLSIDYLGMMDVLAVFACSIGLAVSGAWLAVYRHLDEIEPE